MLTTTQHNIIRITNIGPDTDIKQFTIYLFIFLKVTVLRLKINKMK